VILDADTLPADPDALRELLLAERARHAEAIARIEHAWNDSLDAGDIDPTERKEPTVGSEVVLHIDNDNCAVGWIDADRLWLRAHRNSSAGWRHASSVVSVQSPVSLFFHPFVDNPEPTSIN
jgi:hypothetical protein